MKTKGILFSTAMVQAIMDGRKSMTRRVVKVDKLNEWQAVNDCRKEWVKADVPCYLARLKASEAIGVMYPKYDVGDILWVRETWAKPEDVSNYTFDPALKPGEYLFKADMTNPLDIAGKWRPSIFMPREAARIWLRVTNVRCERVQEITDSDAIHEGCSGAECDCLKLGRGWMGCESCMNTGWQEPPTVEFMQLWDCLNSKRGYGWDANPWVFVYLFERIEKNEAMQ
jgi:hypothetical protein